MAARSSVAGTVPGAEDVADLVPAAQVSREVLVPTAQAAQVDDPLEPGLGGRLGEVPAPPGGRGSANPRSPPAIEWTR